MATGDVQDVLIWGPDGKWTSLEGPEGPAGQAATVDVGTTTTGAAGSDAAVVNAGSEAAAILNFSIPTGAAGPAGTAGTQQVGTVTTNQLNPGSDATVVINNSGNATSAKYDYTFSLASGAKGSDGKDGTDGKDGKDGTGVNILGEKESEGDLPNDGSQKSGDAWLVDGDLYVWDSESSLWVNVGSIQGPPGLNGSPGEDGEDGQPGNAATVSATANATQVACNQPASVVVTNNGDANAAQFAFSFDLPSGCDGEQGDPGKDGDNFEVYSQPNQPTAQNVGAMWIQTAP